MKQRVISALVISAIGIVAVVLGGIVLDIFLLLIAMVGLYEFYGAFEKKGHSPIKLYGLVFLAFFVLMLYNGGSFMEIIITSKIWSNQYFPAAFYNIFAFTVGNNCFPL